MGQKYAKYACREKGVVVHPKKGDQANLRDGNFLETRVMEFEQEDAELFGRPMPTNYDLKVFVTRGQIERLTI